MIKNIDHIALKAFWKWRESVQRQIPDSQIDEEDEQGIIEDFTDVAYEALRSVDKKYGKSQTWYEHFQAMGYIDGYVQGSISTHWSYKYLPPPPQLEYLIWFLAFKDYARVHEDTRIKVNRLYTHYKKYRIMGNGDHLLKEADQLKAHHVISDLQADLNWKNFESVFETFYEKDVRRAMSGYKNIGYEKNTKLFTYDELELLYKLRRRRKKK